MLVSDEGFRGLVIRLGVRGTEIVEDNSDHILIRAGAGENWDEFVAYCVENNYSGIECLSGIPSSVGASPIQNVGAYGQEVKDTIVKVEAIDVDDLSSKEFRCDDCDFEYRTSIFKRENKYIVTHVTYKLSKNYKPEFKYKSLKETFSGFEPTLEQVREKVLEIRKSKSMVYDKDDINSHSTGSYFLNPIVGKEKAKKLLEDFPDMPHWNQKDSRVKLAAGWLIENAGFNKGYKYKSASLSDKHALAMVNRGEATASDIYEFSNVIREKVLGIFGVGLESETVLVGEF